MSETKIMATLSDRRASANFINALFEAGAESLRINSAHVEPSTLGEMVRLIRSTAPSMKILMDTKGPEMRTTDCPTPIHLKEGDTVEVATSTEPTVPGRIHTPAKGIASLAHIGDYLLIDDGAIEVEITATENDKIYGKVTTGGTLESRKTMAFSHGELPDLPAVSERDQLMIRAASETGIDMIAHSFVRSAKDVEAVRQAACNPYIEIYTKIECRDALANLDSIIAAADGILIARGDLATAIDPTTIPAIQYEIARRCRQAGKPFIVSTQILHSMTDNPRPTRAETSDIALGVMEGADRLLLCGETAQGLYPAECVDTMRRTIESVSNLRSIL